MEMNKVEVVALQEGVNKASNELAELSELELSLIGGGMGEVSLG